MKIGPKMEYKHFLSPILKIHVPQSQYSIKILFSNVCNEFSVVYLAILKIISRIYYLLLGFSSL